VNLENILAKHNLRHTGLPDLGCQDDCPACAQKKLVGWLKEHSWDSAPQDWLLLPPEYWQALCREVGLEGGK